RPARHGELGPELPGLDPVPATRDDHADDQGRVPMRMTRLLRRVHGEERGAVAAIVVISLIALLGMCVITVDLGGMLTTRRRVVASADSAALAGAQSCARQLPAEAQSQADAFAVDNQPGATETSFSTQGCRSQQSSGTVTVSYKAPVSLEFAPVLGLPS